MIYTALFWGITLLGVFSYLALIRTMEAARVPSPPRIPFLLLFAAYGAIILFAISELFRVWSGMHSLAAVGLVFVGLPGLIVQAVVLRRSWSLSAYHRAAVILSFGFPAVLATLFLFVSER